MLKVLATTPLWSYERSEVTHEMARDEARHGKALKGLLERYFAADIAKEKVKDAAEKAADKVGSAVNTVVEKIKNM